MCGILGTTCKKSHIDDAIKSIQHRGPNGNRVEELPDCSLGFVRLAIRDLSDAAMQPMSDQNKMIWLVYNGEIYGTNKLKKKLIEKGYSFKTTSDTEIILNAYLEYSDKFIKYIDGMFAIAIYDIRKKKIFLFRDRIGIKPLYYFYDGKNFSFASELKAILLIHKEKKIERDNTAIYDYFTYRYIPEPKTLYKTIYKLEPAQKITYSIDENILIKEKFWKLKVNTKYEEEKNKQEVYENIRNLISKSIKSHMISDVPVGTFLSGGIDSSIVSAEAYKINKNLKMFSMGFDIKNISDNHYDETKYAKELADLYHFSINIEKFTTKDLYKLKKYIKLWFDEPFADTSCYPTFCIAKIAKKNKVPVILTGDGGDEVFGGYTRYQEFNSKIKQRKDWTLLSDLYTKVLKEYLGKEEWEEEFLDAVSLYAKHTYAYNRYDKNEYINELGIGLEYDDFWYFRKFYHKELPPITRAQYIDFNTYLPADILTKVDRTAMQNSIETRVPLLNTKLVEYAFSLSQQDRCEQNELKGVLKNAYKGIIPDSILYKEKKGFSFPGTYWIKNEKDRKIIWDENFKI